MDGDDPAPSVPHRIFAVTRTGPFLESLLSSLVEFLFKYPPRVFERGDFVLAPVIPAPLIALLALLGIGVALWAASRLRGTTGRDRLVIGTLRALALLLVIGCLLRPALMVTSAVPQRNVLAVLLDDSRSMRIADVNGGSRLDAVRSTFADSTALVRALGDKFALRFFRFAADAAPIAGSGALVAGGTRTDLAAALEGARQELADLPVAGVVVVTDGADNAAADLEAPLLGLRARQIPVYTVGVGEERFAKDLAIERLTLPPSTLEGGGAVVEASLRMRGYAGREVTLSVEADGQVVGQEKVTLADDRETMAVPIRVPPLAVGAHRISVRAAALEGETITENNEAQGLFRVRGGREKILYVEGEPRPEFGFLRRAVAEDSALQVVSLLRSAKGKFLRLGVDDSLELVDGFPKRREDLFRYRAIVLGSVEAAFFTGDQLRMLADFVSRRGGGLIALGGRAALAEGGFAGTPLEEILPVALGGNAKRLGDGEVIELAVHPTATGSAQPALQLLPARAENLARWDSLPLVTAVNQFGPLRPGATLLLSGRPVGGGDERPVLATQRYGRGTSAVLAIQDTWLWRMDPKAPAEDRAHHTFWRQLLRWALDDVPDRIELTVSPERGGPGEPVMVRARVADADFLDVSDATVTVSVTPPVGDPIDVVLDRTLQADGTYAGRFTPPVAGAYRLLAEARRGADTARSVELGFLADTLGADVERAELRTPLLTRIAEETGGRYYPLASAGRLPEDVSLTKAGITVRDARDLWDMPIILLALLLLLGGEWLFRRLRGLS